MINMKQVTAIASAEMRLTRRLLRFWVFWVPMLIFATLIELLGPLLAAMGSSLGNIISST